MSELSLATMLLGALTGAALTTYALTPIVARVALRLGIVDLPGGRRVHSGPIPRGGGVAVALGLLLGSLAYGASVASTLGFESLLTTLWRDESLALLLPCALVFGVGLIDDVRGLSPTTRVAIEALAAAFLVQRGYVIDVVANPFGSPIDLGIFAFPITLLWFIGVTNAYNLVDGLDGLLGSMALTALLGCAAVAVLGERGASATMAVALAGSLLGFLRWNWHPARVFLGDSGSLLIGFVIAGLSLKVARNPSGTLAFHVPLLLSAVPIAETLLTLARRYVNGQPFFAGDRSHIHHVLLDRGKSAATATLWLAGISALFAGTAVLSRLWRNDIALGAALTTALLAAAGLRWLGYVELRVLVDRLRHGLTRRRGRELPHLLGMARAGDLIRAARSVPELQGRLREAVEAANLTYLAVEFSPALATTLGDLVRVTDAKNELAEQVARRDRPGLWLFSSAQVEERSELSHPGVCVTIPFSLGGELGGVFAFHRFLDGPDATANDVGLRRYIAEPLRLALGICLLSPTKVGA